MGDGPTGGPVGTPQRHTVLLHAEDIGDAGVGVIGSDQGAVGTGGLVAVFLISAHD